MKLSNNAVENLLIGAGSGLAGALIVGLGFAGFPREELVKMILNLFGVFAAALLTLWAAQEVPKRQMIQNDRVIREQIVASLNAFQVMMNSNNFGDGLAGARGAARAVEIQINLVVELYRKLNNQDVHCLALASGLQVGVEFFSQQLHGPFNMTAPNAIKDFVELNNSHFEPNVGKLIARVSEADAAK